MLRLGVEAQHHLEVRLGGFANRMAQQALHLDEGLRASTLRLDSVPIIAVAGLFNHFNYLINLILTNLFQNLSRRRHARTPGLIARAAATAAPPPATAQKRSNRR